MNQQQTQTPNVNLQLLQQYNLGSFRKVYKGSGWCGLVALGVFAVFCMSFVFVGFVEVWEHAPPDAADTMVITLAFTLLISIGIGLLVIFILGMNHWVTRGSLNAYLYEHGFIYCTSKGIVERVIRWTDIMIFQHKVVESTSCDRDGRTSTSYSDVYTITLRNTEKPVGLVFGKEFAKAVEWKVAHWHYPYARTAYWSGSMARFGSVAVWPQGFYDTDTRAMLPWSEVESIKVNYYGTVYIKKVGEQRTWASFPIGALNNPEVLRRLIATEVPYRFEVLLSR